MSICPSIARDGDEWRVEKAGRGLHFVDFCRFRDLGLRLASGSWDLASVSRFVENKGRIGFVRFFWFGFDRVRRIVTGRTFLIFL